MILTDAVVLITGGRRVGAAIAHALADRGANVALTYRRSRDQAEATAVEVQRRGGRGLALPADLAQPDQAERAVAVTLERFGRLDILLNLVSDYERVAFDDLTADHLTRMVATNLNAPFYVAVAAARAIRANSPGPHGLKGKILFYGDWMTDRPEPGLLPYLTAKGALTTLTLGLAVELAPEITVNLIQPGTVLPPPNLDEGEARRILQTTPLQRFGSPEDIVAATLFLLEGTDFATGAILRVDGGRFLGSPAR